MQTYRAVDNNFYRDYAVAKNKPYMIAETAAAFHENSPFGAGVGELETKRSWWRQYITNPTFLAAHPNLKLICLFEFQKFEETFADGTPSLRDFRATTDPTILAAFLADLGPARSFYLTGNFTGTPPTVVAGGSTVRTGDLPPSGSGPTPGGTGTSVPGQKSASTSLAAWTRGLLVGLVGLVGLMV